MDYQIFVLWPLLVNSIIIFFAVSLAKPSALTPEKGEIIHYYAVNRWDEDDEFDERAKPAVAL